MLKIKLNLICSIIVVVQGLKRECQDDGGPEDLYCGWGHLRTLDTSTALLPAKIVILFAVSVIKVKCILRSKVLLQLQGRSKTRK